MAVAIDIGNPDDIHPKNKQEVARRLSLIALRRSYGHNDVVDRAPSVAGYDISGNTAELIFDGEVKVDGTSPRGFIVRTDDGKWAKAKAVMTSDDTVTLTAEGNITALKYNWADYPDGNLRGTTGLPVPQFSINKQ